MTVLVSTTTINTGLWDPMERSTVFDTKLTPSQSSKENIGNNFYSFQMRTAAYSDLYEGEVNRVGNFMGVNVYSNVDLIELFKIYNSAYEKTPNQSVISITLQYCLEGKTTSP